MITSDSVKTISEALRAAQYNIVAPLKTKTARVNMKGGGTYSYTYADLGDIIDTLRPVLNEHGLAFVQDALEANGGVRVSTRILHTSGEWIEFGPLFLPAGETPQAYGSAITYARRYALTTAFGIAAEEDDDGQAGKPARQRASGGSSSGESASAASPPVSQQGTPPEPTSGKGAGGAGDGSSTSYGEGLAAPVPATNDLATEEDWATATKNGLTASKAKAIAKGLGIIVANATDLTRADFAVVINKYLEMQAAKAK